MGSDSKRLSWTEGDGGERTKEVEAAEGVDVREDNNTVNTSLFPSLTFNLNQMVSEQTQPDSLGFSSLPTALSPLKEESKNDGLPSSSKEIGLDVDEEWEGELDDDSEYYTSDSEVDSDDDEGMMHQILRWSRADVKCYGVSDTDTDEKTHQKFIDEFKKTHSIFVDGVFESQRKHQVQLLGRELKRVLKGHKFHIKKGCGHFEGVSLLFF